MTVAERLLGLPASRSERVRARRAQVLRTYEPASPLEPPRLRKRKSLRRRYDLTLPLEARPMVRLPAVPVVHWGPRLLSAAMLAVCLAGLRQVLASDGFAVAEAAVVGNHMLTAGQIRSVARTDHRPSFLVDPQDSARRLRALPEVEAARVRVGWPNRVTIEVEERHPLVAWTDGGRVWWISPEGVAFLQHGEWPGLVKVVADQPTLEIGANPLEPALAPELIWAAGALSAQVPEVANLRFHPEYGLGYDDPRGWTVYFGHGGDMVAKMQLYQVLAEHIAARGIRPMLVNVADPEAPYYTTAKGPS
jgi:hypothetical protein